MASEFGGRTGLAAIEETLAMYGSKANAPAWLQPNFDKLEVMFGESSTGSGVLHVGDANGKSVNNQEVENAAGLDGHVYQYTDLSDALYDFSTRYANALASGSAAAFSILNPTNASGASVASTASGSGVGGYGVLSPALGGTQDFLA